jgi:hypothetical protein
MRFNIISAVCLVGSVIATPIELTTQDISVVDAAMRRVSSTMQNLDIALRRLGPYKDAGEADAQITWVLPYAQGLIDDLRFGSREIRRGPTVNTAEALSLPQKTDTMFKQLQSVITGVRSARPIAIAAGKKLWVLDTLMNGSDAMREFFDAIISKLGPVEAGLSLGTKQQFLRAFDAVVQEYRRS